MTALTTFQTLLIEHGTADIPLQTVAVKYLGLGHEKAKEYAVTNRLPFPTYRGGSSRKSVRLVKAQDLAAWLDQQYQAARTEWEMVNH